MTTDILIGLSIVLAALGFIALLVIKSQKTIKNIQKKKLTSVREIMNEVNGD